MTQAHHPNRLSRFTQPSYCLIMIDCHIECCEFTPARQAGHCGKSELCGTPKLFKNFFFNWWHHISSRKRNLSQGNTGRDWQLILFFEFPDMSKQCWLMRNYLGGAITVWEQLGK